MNGFWFVLPLLIIRYGVLRLMGRRPMERAGHFPPLEGIERTFLWIYQLSTTALIFYPAALRVVVVTSSVSYVGLGLYILGVVGYLISCLNFSKADADEFSATGLYRISRNPMYVTFFLVFWGLVLLTFSFPLFTLLLLHHISVHFMIRSEERWCLNTYGAKYRNYSEQVSRYL